MIQSECHNFVTPNEWIDPGIKSVAAYLKKEWKARCYMLLDGKTQHHPELCQTEFDPVSGPDGPFAGNTRDGGT